MQRSCIFLLSVVIGAVVASRNEPSSQPSFAYAEQLHLHALGRSPGGRFQPGWLTSAVWRQRLQTALPSSEGAPRRWRPTAYFPPSISRIVEEFGVRELSISLSRGDWDAARYGPQPLSSRVPAGVFVAAELWRQERGVLHRSAETRWRLLIRQLSGMACHALATGINSDDEFSADAALPLSTVSRGGGKGYNRGFSHVSLGHGGVKRGWYTLSQPRAGTRSTSRFILSIGDAPVCTESLRALIVGTLPCGSHSPTATLVLDPAQLFAAPYLSLGLSLSAEECGGRAGAPDEAPGRNDSGRRDAATRGLLAHNCSLRLRSSVAFVQEGRHIVYSPLSGPVPYTSHDKSGDGGAVKKTAVVEHWPAPLRADGSLPLGPDPSTHGSAVPLLALFRRFAPPPASLRQAHVLPDSTKAAVPASCPCAAECGHSGSREDPNRGQAPNSDFSPRNSEGPACPACSSGINSSTTCSGSSCSTQLSVARLGDDAFLASHQGADSAAWREWAAECEAVLRGALALCPLARPPSDPAQGAVDGAGDAAPNDQGAEGAWDEEWESGAWVHDQPPPQPFSPLDYASQGRSGSGSCGAIFASFQELSRAVIVLHACSPPPVVNKSFPAAGATLSTAAPEGDGSIGAASGHPPTATARRRASPVVPAPSVDLAAAASVSARRTLMEHSLGKGGILTEIALPLSTGCPPSGEGAASAGGSAPAAQPSTASRGGCAPLTVHLVSLLPWYLKMDDDAAAVDWWGGNATARHLHAGGGTRAVRAWIRADMRASASGSDCGEAPPWSGEGESPPWARVAGESASGVPPPRKFPHSSLLEEADDTVFATALLAPAVSHGPPGLTLASLTLRPGTRGYIWQPFTAPLMHAEDLPPDVHRGLDVPPAHLLVPVQGPGVDAPVPQGCDRLAEQILRPGESDALALLWPGQLQSGGGGAVSVGPCRYIPLFTDPLLVEPLSPDFSMPFNVMTLIMTVFAFVFGTFLNVLGRKKKKPAGAVGAPGAAALECTTL